MPTPLNLRYCPTQVPTRPSRLRSPLAPRRAAVSAQADASKPKPRLASDDAARMSRNAANELGDALLFAPDVGPAPPLKVETPAGSAALGTNRLMFSEHNESLLIVNRGGLAAVHLGQDANLPINASFFRNTGAIGGGASVAVTQGDDVQTRLGLDGFGARRFGGAAISGNWIGHGCRVGLGVGFFGSTDATLRVLEASPNRPDHVLVEWRQYTGPGIAFDPAGVAQMLGVGGKLVFSRGKQVIFRTPMPLPEVRELLRKHRPSAAGLLPLMQRLALTARWKQPPMQVPDVADPLGALPGNVPLKPGESLVMNCSGSRTFGLAPGVLGARLGAFAVATGEHEVAVLRLEDGRLLVAISPRQVRAVSVGADMLVLADVRHQHAVAEALREEVVIDPESPEAMKVYADLIRQGRTSATSIDPAEVEAAHQRRPEVPGVDYLLRETVQTTKQGWSTGIPRIIGIKPETGISGAGIQPGRHRETHVATDGETTTVTVSAGSSRDVHMFLLGTRGRSTQTSRQEILAPADATGSRSRLFSSLTMQTGMHHSRASGGSLNEMVRMLRRAFALPVEFFSEQGHHQDYSMTVQRVFSMDDLSRLRASNLAAAAQAAEACGAPTAPLVAMLRRIAAMHAEEACQIADAVQTFVSAHGAFGMGAIHRLCGGSKDDLQVSVQSSDFRTPLDDLTQLELQHETLGAAAPPHVQQKVELLKNQLDVSLRALQTDPIVAQVEPEGQRQQGMALQRGQSKLAVLAPKPLPKGFERVQAWFMRAVHGEIARES